MSSTSNEDQRTGTEPTSGVADTFGTYLATLEKYRKTEEPGERVPSGAEEVPNGPEQAGFKALAIVLAALLSRRVAPRMGDIASALPDLDSSQILSAVERLKQAGLVTTTGDGDAELVEPTEELLTMTRSAKGA